MFSGNDEHMRRRLGIDIVERDHQIIFIDERVREWSVRRFCKRGTHS